MNEHQLTELLERGGDGVRVSPAPLDALHAGAVRRRRRRRWVGALASAGVAVALAGGTAMVLSPDRGEPPATADPADDKPRPDLPPDGMRWAGIGSIAVAVPEKWGMNRTHCGTPRRDTVVVWQGGINTCLIPRPAGVESVELGEGEAWGFEPDSTVVIDGVEAKQQSTTCEERTNLRGAPNGVLCTAVLRFPDEGVWVRVESSTSAEKVEAILSRVHVLTGLVGVPDYSGIAAEAQEKSQEAYTRLLQERGFAVEVETKKMWPATPGHVLSTSPLPGTVVEPGSTITITVTAEPEGPGDELSVGVSADPDVAGEITEEAVRSGELVVRLKVGERVWSYAHGKRARTLAGEVTGEGLAVDDWRDGPNYPHSWIATAPGRSTVVLTIDVDSEPLELGRFTVIVN